MSLCETRIEYNGVTLRGVLTEDISFDPVYDGTGTDLIGLHTKITCTAYVHSVFPVTHGVNAVWQTGASRWPDAIRLLFRQLSFPRRHFHMTINGATLFDILPVAVEAPTPILEDGEIVVIPVDGSPPITKPITIDTGKSSPCNPTTPRTTTLDYDIAHGPKCNYQILGIKGGTTARARFTFEFTTPLCENPEKIQDFLHLRWWIADDVDGKTWQTTRTYQGTFRVKGMNVDSHALARQITLPPIQPGFRRSRINWSESPDHLTLNFTITDVEQYAQAPAPATHWEGTYSISVPQGDITSEAELRFRLWSDNRTDKTFLFQLAQYIIDAKLHYHDITRDEKGAPNMLVMAQVWEERLEANEISCYVKIKHMGSKDGDAIVSHFIQNVQPIGNKFELGRPLPESVSDFDLNPRKRKYDPYQVYTAPGGLPTAGLAGIFVCALQTPCCPQTLSNKPVQEQQDITYEEGPYLGDTRPPAEPSEDADSDRRRYSDSHREYPYLWYRMTNHYHRDSGWRAFPIGRQCTATSTNTVAFSQLHCAVAIREIRLEAARMNKTPEVPDFRDSWVDDQTGIRYVLKDVVYEPMPPQLTADAKHEIREVYARYFYYMSRPPTAAEAWLAGRVPYIAAGSKPLPDEPADEPGNLVAPSAFSNPTILFGREAPNPLLLNQPDQGGNT